MYENMAQEREFLQELKALLQKYNGSITWGCGFGSDTHGIYGETMSVEMGNTTIFTTEEGEGYLTAKNLDIPWDTSYTTSPAQDVDRGIT